jgi:hypothetical protein
MTFEEWFNEIEGYNTRGERFDEWMFSTGGGEKGKDWLKAAYNAGFREGLKQDRPIPVPTPPYVKYPTRDHITPDPFKRTHEATCPNIKSCSKCGMNLSGVMGYVCYDLKCPTQIRIITGGGSTLSGAHSGSAGARGSVYSDIGGYTNCKDKK